MVSKAKSRDCTPIGTIRTNGPNGSHELNIFAEELTCEQLHCIIVRCADILRESAEIKFN